MIDNIGNCAKCGKVIINNEKCECWDKQRFYIVDNGEDKIYLTDFQQVCDFLLDNAEGWLCEIDSEIKLGIEYLTEEEVGALGEYNG